MLETMKGTGMDSSLGRPEQIEADNPDRVDIVIHNYRRRLGLAAGEPQHDELELRGAT
jgi:hypothetical protein